MNHKLILPPILPILAFGITPALPHRFRRGYMLRRSAPGPARRSMLPLQKRWGRGGVVPNAKIGRIGVRISLWFVFRS